jgi:hypothetical protein
MIAVRMLAAACLPPETDDDDNPFIGAPLNIDLSVLTQLWMKRFTRVYFVAGMWLIQIKV